MMLDRHIPPTTMCCLFSDFPTFLNFTDALMTLFFHDSYSLMLTGIKTDEENTEHGQGFNNRQQCDNAVWLSRKKVVSWFRSDTQLK